MILSIKNGDSAMNRRLYPEFVATSNGDMMIDQFRALFSESPMYLLSNGT